VSLEENLKMIHRLITIFPGDIDNSKRKDAFVKENPTVTWQTAVHKTTSPAASPFIFTALFGG
jgi:hypothetical protein